MYERFTDRARKVVQLANQVAHTFNHDYIGTEHILLGLVKEGSGVASYVLNNLNIDPRKVRLEVEKLIQSGPEKITMGKLPQTPRAKKVYEYAIEEARNLNHNYVCTEHILLGLLREQEGVASQVLIGLGVSLDNARKEAVSLLSELATDMSETMEFFMGKRSMTVQIRKDNDGAIRIGVGSCVIVMTPEEANNLSVLIGLAVKSPQFSVVLDMAK